MVAAAFSGLQSSRDPCNETIHNGSRIRRNKCSHIKNNRCETLPVNGTEKTGTDVIYWYAMVETIRFNTLLVIDVKY